VGLVIYAIAGLWSAFHGKRLGDPSVRYAGYQPAAGETDRQTAERVVAQLGLTLATPVQAAAIQHDQAGNLVLDFYHANGRHRVTVLRSQNRLRIEAAENSPARYATILHLTTGVFHSGDWRMQAWAYYNEFTLWCFVVMLASAAWMAVARLGNLAGAWSGAFAKMRTLHLAAAIVFLPFAMILAISSVQMAHRTWFAPTGVIAWANRVHRSSAGTAGLAAACIFLLTATGLYLWVRNRRGRAMGALLGIPVGAAALALVVVMRTG